MDKGKIAISIVIFFITVMLVTLTSIQFRTVEETNQMGIETMREDELRQEIVEWKSKYNEVDEKLKSNNEKIEEYSNTIKNNQQSSNLLDEELKEYNMLVGKTNVAGEGVILHLTDSDEQSYMGGNLVYLVNELKSAGAEAISINNQRIVNTTEIVTIANAYILVNGQRVQSPYEVKAIGNKEKLNEQLNFPNDGYIADYKSRGYKIEMSVETNVQIPAYNQDMQLKYIKEAQ